MDIMTQVANLDRHMTTRGEIVAFFRRVYPGSTKGHENWKPHMSDAVMPFTKGTKTAHQSKETIMRRFRDRGAKSWQSINPSKKQQEEYRALGQKLPKIPPALGYHIEGPVCIKFPSPDECEERQWDHKVIGENKMHLWRTSSLQGLINIYMGDLWDTEEPNASPCEQEDNDDCETNLVITALTKEQFEELPNLDGGF